MTSKAASSSAEKALGKAKSGGMLDDMFGTYKTEFMEMLRRELQTHVQSHRESVSADLKRVVDTIREVEAGLYRNVQLAAQRKALDTSAEFMVNNMLKAAAFPHPHATLEHALTLSPKGGLALEFGVFSGTTLRIIADKRGGQKVYGFDSFEGLPEAWRSDFPAGAFAVNEPPQVDGAELVIGWFDATLPRFLERHPGPVDFLHIDCDLYSSTKTVLDLVGSRLRPGSIVMFDEYFNYPGWEQHEAKAWDEFLAKTGMQISYDAYTFNNEQVVARITAL